MKINSASPVNSSNLLKKQNIKDFEIKNKSLSSNSVNFKGENRVDPLYYQALYLIFPNSPVYISGKLENGEDFSIQIEDEFADKFLRDGKGKIKEADFKKFMEIHNKIANDLNQQFHNELESYSNQKSDSAISQILEMFGQEMKNVTNENIKKVPYYAYDKTKRYFELSQTSIGMDYSDYERKINLIGEIAAHTNQDLYPHDENVTYQQISEYAKDKYGRPDYDLIHDAFTVISAQGFCVSLKDAICLIKKYYSYDENAKQLIKCAMIHLGESYFDLSSNLENSEKLLDLCFNQDKTFNPQKAEILREAHEYMSCQIDDALKNINFSSAGQEGFPDDIEQDDMYNLEDSYQDIVNAGADVIVRYFSEITDAMGNLKPQRKSFKEYIQENYSN